MTPPRAAMCCWRSGRLAGKPASPTRALTFAEAVELARGLDSSDRLARAALGAGGRFYAPGATDEAYIDLLEEALAALEPGDSVLRVQVLARLAEKLVFAQPPQRAGELAAEAIGMARRLGEAGRARSCADGAPCGASAPRACEERRRVGEQGSPWPASWERSSWGRCAPLAALRPRRSRRDEGSAPPASRARPDAPTSCNSRSTVTLAGLARRVGGARWALRGSRADRPRIRTRWPNTRSPDAQAHFTAQLLALRREQGRLHELLPEIERLAGEEPSAFAWRSILPLAYLDAGTGRRHGRV